MENICINCKRALNKEGCSCSWAERLVPVKGWTATKVLRKIWINEQGKQIYNQGWHVTACPLYIQDVECMTVIEWYKKIAKELNKCPNTIFKKFDKYAPLYEQKTGEKIPEWVFVEREEKD